MKKACKVYIYIYIYIYIFLHPLLTSKPATMTQSPLRPLNSVQTLQPTELSGHELNSHSEPTVYSYFNFISLLNVQVSFRSLPSSVATFVFSEISHMSAAEWTDTYGIHHWRILRSSYRKLGWVGFEPATTEFRSDTLTD